jgi:hypothetical protein
MNGKYFEKHYNAQWLDLKKKLDNHYMPIECNAKVHKAEGSTMVNVAIPTLGLRPHITDTIDTFLTSTYEHIRIVVLVQEQAEMAGKLREMYKKDKRVEVIFDPNRRGWIHCINTIAKMDGHLFAVGDDVCVFRDTIEVLVSEMERLFSDGDGVLGTNHTYTHAHTGHKPGWAMAFPFIGSKFIDRFPGRQVLCPDYVNYSGDVELPDYALSVNRCFVVPDAKVIHFERRTMDTDATSKIVREAGLPDIERYFIRQQRGLLWGKNFDLIRGTA